MSNGFKQHDLFLKIFFNGKIIVDNVDKEQSNLSVKVLNFKEKAIPKISERKKMILLKSDMHFLTGEKWFLMVFKVEYFH